MAYLKFISDKDLIQAVDKVVKVIELTKNEANNNFYKNVIDPFSALFNGITHKTTYEEWIRQEKGRQTQKTIQNSIGIFHQDVLGSIQGWVNLGSGGGLDVANKEKKIIAEIKNKFNTTKGNHRAEIYDAIKSKLKDKKFSGFIGYYVEIIPKSKNRYDNPYTPSDNKTKKRRPIDKKIRVIDGVSFYALASNRENALFELFKVLPIILIDIYKYKLNKKEINKYLDFFGAAFSMKK